MTHLVPAVVFVPLLGALLAVVVPRIGAAVTAVCSVAGLALAVTLASTVAADGPILFSLSGWAEPVGIGLRVDGMSTTFLLMTAVVGALVSVYASGSAKARGTEFYWPLWLFVWAGCNAVYIAGDLFNTYVALELLTVAAVGAVALGGASAYPAALRYLVVAVAGSLWFLFAVALLYAETGTLSLAGVVDVAEPGPTLTAVAVIATVGLAMKTALVPMHAWLPPAHAGAPSAVSPLMSALVVKASLFVLFRLWTSLPTDDRTLALSQAVGGLGAIAVLWGSVVAFRQVRLKRVIAYSTVAQVGYFLLLVPLVAPALVPGAEERARELGEMAIQGTVAFVVAHALAKAAMFTAAGCLLEAYGTDELSSLRGAVIGHPASVFAFGLAGISLAGLPPALAFAGKWQLLTASIESGQWWWLIVLLGGGLLTAAYTVRVLTVLMSTADEDAPEPVGVPTRMGYASVSAAVAAVVLGLAASGLIAASSTGVLVLSGGAG